MSHSATLGNICYEAESSWGEDSTSFATARLPVLDEVDTSGLTWRKDAPGLVMQYRSDGAPHILMTMGGSFKTKMYLCGHGSTTAGAVTISALSTLLGYVFGNAAVGPAGTTLTGGTATVPTTTASGTFSAGGLCAIGALGDGDGSGQMYPIATHTTTNLTLLVDLDGAPANGAVLYSATNIYPSVTPTTSAITGLRFLISKANLRYEAHGCFPMSVSITGLNTGEKPVIEVEWGVSWWRHSTATFPSAVSQTADNPAPVAAGSFNVQTVGTSTRAKRTVREVSLTYTLGVAPVMSPGGVNAYQAITGAVRVDDKVQWSWVEDADANTASPALGGFYESSNKKHIMYTMTAVDGKRVGIYTRQCCIADGYPVQFTREGRNSVRIVADAYVGPTTTNDLTMSPFLMGLA